MEETKIEQEEEKVEEVKSEVVEEKADVKAEVPTGYYLAEVPTGHTTILALGNQQVTAEELIVKMANALTEAGLLK